MSDIVIRASNLGKQYRIGGQLLSNRTFREDIMDGITAPVRWLRGERKQPETFWALEDISFEVKRGEAVGIIGRNGAGKSTLLKILSRITRPTRGKAELFGRVGSLLEVGTGFHTELTGRENVYLNGAILGMSRREIIRKFDEIVEFSGVERFLDTPVKFYSSGMYVRLAFAVAAHLEPEILVVDEVLAVGDAEFQKKCLGKMNDVAHEGRTVLFVSHNMVAVQQLCQRGFVIKAGMLDFEGGIDEVITKYIRNLQAVISETELENRKDRKGSQRLKFSKVALYDKEGHEIPQVLSGQAITIRIFYRSSMEKARATVIVAFNLRNEQGVLLTNLNSRDSGYENLSIYNQGYFECSWSKFNFRSGTYSCDLFCSVNGEIVDWLQDAFSIHVEDGDFYGTGKMIERVQGDVLIQNSWESSRTSWESWELI